MFESILNNFQEFLVFLIFLGILVTVHEWGHFITAKKLGVRVEEFALGFGHTLFSKVYNGTNYLIKALPLGGYVKMSGDERSKCSGAPEEFYSKPVGHRALIVLNGPVINFVLAYVCLVLVFMMGYLNPDPKIAGLKADSPAAVAGLRSGDVIKSINGQEIYYYKELKKIIRLAPEKSLSIDFLRDGKPMQVQVPVITAEEADDLGIAALTQTIGLDEYSNVIGGIGKDEPALAAGLKPGDRILDIQGKPIFGWADIQAAVKASKAKPIDVTYEREGKVSTVTVTPRMLEREGRRGEKANVAIVGIGPLPQDITSHRFGFIESIRRGADEFMDITVLTYRALYSMVTGKMSARESVGGPVLIFSIVAESVNRGLAYFLFILGVISLNLAIFNLLPVIPLDGGHLFLMAIEKARGKAMSPKIDDFIARAGFALIILLAVYVFYIDFDRIGLIDKIKSIFL